MSLLPLAPLFALFCHDCIPRGERVCPAIYQRAHDTFVQEVSGAGSRAFVGAALPAGGKPAAATLVRHSAPKDAWRTLHDLLIRPVAAALPQTPGALLTIVPHGPISRLSFVALVDDRGRYLLERYALHYRLSRGVAGAL